MSRYFTMVLLLVVLTTQSAWAMHSDIIVQHLDDTHIVLKSNSATTVSFESCDHLCHAAAHLLGLLSTCSAEFGTMVHAQKISAYGLNTLFKYQPSIPPPIS